MTLPTAVHLNLVGVQFDGWTNALGTVVTNWPARSLTGNQTFYAKLAPVVQEVYNAGATIDCTDAAAAADLAATINADKAAHITMPAAVGSDPVRQAEYASLFEATADGTSVTIDFTEEAAAYQATNVATRVAQAIDLSGVAAASAGVVLDPDGLTPGLWYSVVSGTSVTSINNEGTRVQAQSDGTLGDATLVVPHPSDAAGFFKIKVSPADKPAPVPNQD